MKKEIKIITMIGITVVFIGACSPTIEVQAPDKPIEINMNIKIEQEILIKVDKELDALFAKHSDLFGANQKP